MTPIGNQGVFAYPNVPANTPTVIAAFQLANTPNAAYTLSAVKAWSTGGCKDFVMAVYLNFPSEIDGSRSEYGAMNGRAYTDDLAGTVMAGNAILTIVVEHFDVGLSYDFKSLIIGRGQI